MISAPHNQLYGLESDPAIYVCEGVTEMSAVDGLSDDEVMGELYSRGIFRFMAARRRNDRWRDLVVSAARQLEVDRASQLVLDETRYHDG
jgi:hypothetical protein